MFTATLIQDLFAHMAWADAQVWRVALTPGEGHADPRLRDQLFHIHLTQRAFLQIWTEQPLGRFRGLSFDSLAELYAWVRQYYPEVSVFLDSLEGRHLQAPIPVPWVKLFAQRLPGQAATPTLGETLFQVTSHSTYHRGQVNTRLRELGSEPPLVDYIAWVWLGRPFASWPAAISPSAAPNPPLELTGRDLHRRGPEDIS